MEKPAEIQHVALPVPYAEALLRYLVTRPYAEVEGHVNMLRSLQLIQPAPTEG